MKGTTGKVIALAVAASMMFSVTGCFDKAKEQVTEAADAYADALSKVSTKKLKKLSDDADESLIGNLEDGGSSVNADTAAVISAISGTLSYEVDEDSIEGATKTGKGHADVVFTIADYEDIVSNPDDYDSAEDMIDAIEDADTTEMEIGLDFNLDGEDWLVTNFDDIYEDLYSYYDLELNFVRLADYVSGGYWYYAEDQDGNYVNTSTIDLDIQYNSYDIDTSGVYYTVEFGGQVVYTSNPGTFEGYYRESEGAVLDDNGFIPEGDYTIKFYGPGDEELLTGVAHVTVDLSETEAEGGYWYFKDGEQNGVAYYENATVIDLDVYVDNYSNIYYTVDYNGDLVYTSDTGTYEGYFRSSWPEATLDESGDYLAAGTYTITFYNGSTQIYSDSCIVSTGDSSVEPSMVDHTTWYFADRSDGDEAWYEDADLIDMDISVNGSYSSVFYTVSLNGDVLYTSDTGTYEGYYGEYYGDPELTSDGNLIPGDYVITFFSGDTELASGTAHVS